MNLLVFMNVRRIMLYNSAHSLSPPFPIIGPDVEVSTVRTTGYVIVPLFELDHRVSQHVAHVNLSSQSQDVGVFLLHEPSHVREK